MNLCVANLYQTNRFYYHVAQKIISIIRNDYLFKRYLRNMHTISALLWPGTTDFADIFWCYFTGTETIVCVTPVPVKQPWKKWNKLRRLIIDNTTLKRKCSHFDEIQFITACTGSCQNDNFQCSQWWKYNQNDYISISVNHNTILHYITDCFTGYTNTS